MAPAQAGRKRARRKEARPGEIIDAALDVFLEQGFGAAKLDDIASRAGVAKGTIFLYFSNKEDLFRAAANAALAANFSTIQGIGADPDIPLAIFIPALLKQATHSQDSKVTGLATLLITEARAFPDLARIWYDEVVSKILGLLTTAIERGQKRGEVKPGDPGLYAFSIIGPMMSAVLFRNIFSTTPAALPDIEKLAEQHAQTVLNGLLKT